MSRALIVILSIFRQSLPVLIFSLFIFTCDSNKVATYFSFDLNIIEDIGFHFHWNLSSGFLVMIMKVLYLIFFHIHPTVLLKSFILTDQRPLVLPGSNVIHLYKLIVINLNSSMLVIKVSYSSSDTIFSLLFLLLYLCLDI